MNYLVTGGAGFIGSHLSNALSLLGHNVTVIDDLSSGDQNLLNKNINFIKGDIENLNDCLNCTKGIDGLFHMAAFSRSGPSFNQPEKCHFSNAEGTLNMLIASKANNVKRFIYSGSSTFYGNTIGKQKETDTGDFLNFYGLSKHIGELYVQQFNKNYNLETNILRYFNVYGPGQPKTGAYALVLGIFLDKFKNNESIEIHGTGNQRRDFIHVSDIVTANIKAMESVIQGEIFNVGSGINYSINEIANYFPNKKSFIDRRKGDAEETLADIAKIKNLLNWEPIITLKDGISNLMKS